MAFYKQSRPTPTGTRWSGTDHADTLADAATAYKRCRTRKSFVLTAESPDLALSCSCCGQPLNVFPSDTLDGYKGNRVEYFPKTKRFRLMHYMCSWGALLGAIGTTYSLAEAASTYERLAGRTITL